MHGSAWVMAAIWSFEYLIFFSQIFLFLSLWIGCWFTLFHPMVADINVLQLENFKWIFVAEKLKWIIPISNANIKIWLKQMNHMIPFIWKTLQIICLNKRIQQQRTKKEEKETKHNDWQNARKSWKILQFHMEL